MRRLLPLWVFTAAMVAADAAPADDTLVIDRIQWYRYALDQTVAWSSVGDELTYEQRLVWTFALRPTAVTDTTATLNATITRIEASSNGPGYERRFDTRTPTPETDALFGHLGAVTGTTLTLTIARSTGEVTAVTGGEAVIAAVSARLPAASPGQPSPFATEIAQRYNDEALARWWSTLLIRPGTTSPLPLNADPTVAITRQWDATAFTLSLPADTSPPRLVLARDPTPVTATLSALSGSGKVTPQGGLPGTQSGSLSYTLTVDALTQAVVQRHALTWTLQVIQRAE